MLDIKHIVQQSETSLVVYFDDSISDIALPISQLAEQLRSCDSLSLLEIIPCTSSLYLEFHILATDTTQLLDHIHLLAQNHQPTTQSQPLIELPVYYHPDVAPDLNHLAQRNNLTTDQVIQIHSQTTYTVASLGFAPGFAYLSGLDTRLATPRLNKPKIVAKGSLGIADLQSAIYPDQSPGGWSIIGNCPLDLYHLEDTPITPFQIGMKVKFHPITKIEFIAKGGIV